MPAMPVILTTDLITEMGTGHICVNRLYWQPDTPPTTSTDMIALANQVFAHYAGPFANLMASTSTFGSVHVRYNAPSVDIDGWSTTLPVDGVYDEDALPDEVCYEIQRRTGLIGRQNRGRIFISGGPVTANREGIVHDTFRTALIALAALIGPDQTFSAIGLCHARHWDRKDNVMRGVSQARAVGEFASRRDRRPPLRLIPI